MTAAAGRFPLIPERAGADKDADASLDAVTGVPIDLIEGAGVLPCFSAAIRVSLISIRSSSEEKFSPPIGDAAVSLVDHTPFGSIVT